jgi:sigma-B regulation protein RsbU (phosphoserine phosphatase)
VGGDYFDFFPYSDGSVAMALGDVSGKGMPASLLMMQIHARVQVLAAEDPGDLAAFLTRVNRATCANCPSNRFITFFFCVFNPATGQVRFANAGHNPPIVVRASGQAEMLEGGGPVLGIVPFASYREDATHLERGDTLVLYSDGVTEANNPDFEEYGEQRFIELLQRHRTEPAANIVQAVTRAVDEFAGGAPQADDITLAIAKRM